jgi:elongation factor P
MAFRLFPTNRKAYPILVIPAAQSSVDSQVVWSSRFGFVSVARVFPGDFSEVSPLRFPGATRNAMMIKATDIRRGMVITMEGVNFVVVDFAHHTPGNLRAMVQTKLRNMNSGSLIDKRLRSVDQIEVPYVETKEYEYLYSSGDEHVFMDTETYDQISFTPEILGTAMQYLLPNSRVMVMHVADKPVSIEVPANIELTVVETPPSIKGATATNQYKEATLETGLKLTVPPFVNIGEKIRIDTRTGEYVERVK